MSSPRKLLRNPSSPRLSEPLSPSLSQEGQKFMPISSINIFVPRNWAIKGKCTFKQDIKEFNSKDKNGKVGSVDLLDSTGEIRITLFNDVCFQK